jgi:hypothetical protein
MSLGNSISLHDPRHTSQSSSSNSILNQTSNVDKNEINQYNSYKHFNKNSQNGSIIKHEIKNDNQIKSEPKINNDFLQHHTNISSSLHNLKDVKITSFISTSEIIIPTSYGDNETERSITIQPGEKVFILKTPKGGNFFSKNFFILQI